ncbi:MAG: sigma-70 family RNA polymerase sigma factor [Ruminococcus sp.]|nr:sigma-70 family RNA polymerase sigma factor [Ruminococcus sp.]
MPKSRERYSDSFSGKTDIEIRKILSECDESDEKAVRTKKLMLNVINNELTSRQKHIIMLYYFCGMSIKDIAVRFSVTPQNISAIIKRARIRLYRVLKYYM